VGGLVGVNGGVIRQSFSTANVRGVNADNVGGLVGMLTVNVKGAVIENSYAAGGSVAGRNNVGGLAGYIFGGSVVQCLAVQNSTAGGSVSGSGNVGGLVGYDYGTGNSGKKTYGKTGSGAIAQAAGIARSFWNNSRTSSAGPKGQDVAIQINNDQMANAATYRAWPQADRTLIWNISGIGQPGASWLQGLPPVLDPDDPGGGDPPEVPTYTLAAGVTPEGGGSVRRDPSKDKYGEGETVTVTAVPAGDYEFSGWLEREGDLSNPVTVTMSKDESLTAVFALKEDTSGSGITMYALTVVVEPPEGGEVSRFPNAESYEAGKSVMLSAVPKEGYEFVGWQGRDNLGDRNPAEIVMDGGLSLTAVFRLKDTGGGDPPPGLYINDELASEASVPEGGELKLSVVMAPPNGGTLTYQWYGIVVFGGTPLPFEVSDAEGGKSAVCSPLTNSAGEKYYYVLVFEDGDQIARLPSADGVVTVTVTASSPDTRLEKRPAAALGAKVRGRNLVVTAPHSSVAVVRLIDMKGRTAARFRTAGGAAVPLARVPVGRYMLEVRSGGKVVSVSPAIIK
jgi:hypothetical protein